MLKGLTVGEVQLEMHHKLKPSTEYSLLQFSHCLNGKKLLTLSNVFSNLMESNKMRKIVSHLA